MSRSRLPGRSEERVFLGLGGNIGDPANAMARALDHMDATAGVSIAAISSLYRTPPWGNTNQPDFLNAVAELRTTLSPQALLALCLDVERGLKRVRTERWGPRSIDLDILLFGDRVIESPDLTVPHPRLAERAFVLVPLAEIAPGLMIGGSPIAEFLAAIDASGIEIAASAGWWP